MLKKLFSIFLSGVFLVSSLGTAAAEVPNTANGKLGAVETVTYGQEQTGAIVERIKKLEKDYDFYAYMIEEENGQLRTTAEGMRLSILGKESKTKDEKPLKVVDEYIKENTTEMVDPIDVQKKIEELKVKSDTLLTELDTQIKVSNATTFIAI
jgi:predicted amino acid racemase